MIDIRRLLTGPKTRLMSRVARTPSQLNPVQPSRIHARQCNATLRHPQCLLHAMQSMPITVVLHLHLTHDSPGMRIYASMAALNAAKPAHPRAVACGPALYARAPPVKHPAATLFWRSDFALKPSIQHSVPAYMAPMRAKFFADERERDPMSFMPARSCSRKGSEEMAWDWGVKEESYDICRAAD